jgi:V8-like Glu-specific endopeptidase
MALSIPQIVNALRISRSEFGRIFLQAQMGLVENGEERQLFEAVTHSGIDQEAYAEALTWADQQHFLEIMVRAIAAENLEDGSIYAALTADAAATSSDPARKAALQAITDLSKGFLRPEVFFRGVNIGMRWTVKIMVDGSFQGTGILIGPHLVLTAWHVVRSLFDPDTDPAHKNRFLPKTNGGAKVHTRLSIEFDDLSGVFDSQMSSVGPKRFQAHVQWCAIYSECHPDELRNGLPADLTELDGFWDYAVLRLAKTPGLERRWAALDARAVVPAVNARILVFQYPGGQPMRFDENVVVAPETIVAGVIPRLRFLHKANAVGGSSGSPCFDSQFMLFGLHQGTWVRSAAGAEVVNRGVPIIRIKEHIQQSIRELPVPDPSESPVWKRSAADPLRPEGPIVGCDPFQSLVWKSAVAGSPRFILVGGADHSGKTFRLSVLAAMLPDSGHLKVGLRADAISKLGAMDLAKEVCKAAGSAVPAFVQAADFNSSAGTWVRDELVQKVIQALDAARSGRLVWLTIAELNRTDIQGEQASDFLLSLYEQVRTVDWLRIVLDDMKGDALTTLRAVTERHRVDNVTRIDIETYLSRAIAEFKTPEGDVVRAFAGVAFKQYERWLDERAVDPMDRLSDTLIDTVEEILGR